MTLRLEAVAKEVEGRTHIHPTTLTLERGSLNLLLGPTLAGKTTIMRLMAGLDQPSSGRIFYDGVDVTGRRVQDRRVAMVYQQFINYPTLTVFENIASPLRLQGLPRKAIRAKVEAAAELVKLTPQLNRRPSELSGGQQQRTALARALVKDAELILLDEPLANLDYKLREELRAEIPRLFTESGAIFVYATTEPHEALLLGGNTATLWKGQVTQFGSTPEVYRQPRDAITARLFSDPPMNFIGFDKRDGEALFEDGQPVPVVGGLPALPDGAYRAGFRANHLTLRKPEGTALSFAAEVAITELTGSESFVHLDHGANRWIALQAGLHAPQAGQRVEVFLRPEHLYLFHDDGRLAATAAYAAAA
ncbi:MAG: ABC transporter ATP-binding protein [Rhodospirillales bacterium]|nr:ABC transporter ATP-binding protein [Rhodospirillales bacterium]